MHVLIDSVNPEQKQRIEAQLARILASNLFSGSERHRQFLRYVVEQTLSGETDKLNEFVLGFEVFRKGDSFDPRVDSIVRVEARRLRDRLKKYYDEEGATDEILISMKPRSFVPEFRERSQEGQPSGMTPGHAEDSGAAGGGGRVTRRGLGIGLALGSVAALSGGWWLWREKVRSWLPRPSAILVMPFQTSGAEPGLSSVARSMEDSLIRGLGGVGGLRVLSSGISEENQNVTVADAAKAASELDADYVVEGTVYGAGDLVRISVKLTDTRARSYVWADTRESPVTNVDTLERGFVRDIVSKLRIPLPPGGGDMAPRIRPASREAYSAFLKAQYYWNLRTPGSPEKAIELLEQSVSLDASYAPAWAWLAICYQLTTFQGGKDEAARLAKGRQAVAKAMELAPQLAESQAAAGVYAAAAWDWKRAGEHFERAIQRNPTWAHGHTLYALLFLSPTGQTREAVRQMLRAQELDPVTEFTRTMLAEALYYNQEYDRAMSEIEDLYRTGDSAFPVRGIYLLALCLSGKPGEALRELNGRGKTNGEDPFSLGLRGYFLALDGRAADARSARQALLAQSSSDPGVLLLAAMVSVGLGDTASALASLEKLHGTQPNLLIIAVMDPAFAPLRSLPGYQKLLRSMNLPYSH